MERDGTYGLDSPAPFHAYRVSLPQEKNVQITYKAHKPALESLSLKSEAGRTIFAEAIIENNRLGTLAELCVATLAREFGPRCAQIVAEDEQRLRIFYDSVDIDSPLEEIYDIEDVLFWKRLVQAKTTDQSLKFKDDTFDWKSLGVSMKYAEMVEKCPAEFWPAEKMETLAKRVKNHVEELHIKRLQPLQDYMFQRYLVRDSDTDKSDSTDVSSSTAGESKSSGGSENDFEGEEEEEPATNVAVVEDQEKAGSEQSDEKSSSIQGENAELFRSFEADWTEFDLIRAEEKRRVLEERREERRKRRVAQQERRDRREAKLRERREQLLVEKPKKIRVKDVFNIPVDEEEDVEVKVIDRRNLERFLKQRKLYDYPEKHCHHVDLSFVRLFDNIREFSIIFHPPNLQVKFDTRYFKFSYDDVQRLANGLAEAATLRVFRLRESRMDERKLTMITDVLRFLNVEEVDFGYDYLEDDCDDAIANLFLNTTTSIRSLELEGNNFTTNVVKRLAFVLRNYEGHLEYLGLAHNPVDDEGIHTLCRMLPYFNQIDHLNLTAIQFSEDSLRCCIANELLRNHKTLRQLDLVGCTIDPLSGEEIVRSLEENITLQYFDVRGCDLPLDIEFEIEVCVRRNRYILENPYIGDLEKTAEEIQEFCGRIKNPILLKVLQEVEEEKKCYANRPDIAERFSIHGESYGSESRSTLSQWTDSRITSDKRVSFPDIDDKSAMEPEPPFIYNPNEFNLEQIKAHVFVPGKQNKEPRSEEH